MCHAVRAVQAEELRRQLAEREGELAELGEGLGGLERENANLEAQVTSQLSCLHHPSCCCWQCSCAAAARTSLPMLTAPPYAGSWLPASWI